MHQEKLRERRLESVNHALVNTFGKYIELKFGAKMHHWCKNSPPLPKASRFHSFSSPGDITSGKYFTLESVSEAFWRDRVSRAQSGARKTVFRLVIFGVTAKMSGRIIFKN